MLMFVMPSHTQRGGDRIRRWRAAVASGRGVDDAAYRIGVPPVTAIRAPET
jgi:hypothetical protein